LGRLGLSSAIGAIEAICSQRDIAQKIRTKAADDLLALKKCLTLTEDVHPFFNGSRRGLDVHRTAHGEHRSIELRREKTSMQGRACWGAANNLHCCSTSSSVAISCG
jgi:hypothetical protein